MKKLMKEERGITLIALVVTIIVLLILAGVSIQMLTGQTGILKNAQQAREETVKGQIKEAVQRDIMEKMIEGKKGDITADELYEILKNYFEDVPAPGEGEDNPWNAEDFPKSFPELKSKEGNYPFKLGDIYSGTLSGNITPEDIEVTISLNQTDVTIGVDNTLTIVATTNPKNTEVTWRSSNDNIVSVENNGEITAKASGTVTITASVSDNDGTTKEATCQVKAKSRFSEKYEETKKRENEGTATIPKGFAVGISSDVNNEEKGLVITDNVETVGENHYSTGNEFVWVPVPNAKSETIVTNNTDAIPLGGYNSKTTPMAEKNEGGHYRGVLYDQYNLTGETKTVKYKKYNTSNCHEPDTVTENYDGLNCDAVASNFDVINGILTEEGEKARHTVEKFKETLQEDYDKMVGSVSTYGGFYVARYEMSLSVDKKAQYKEGETIATAETWYEFYAYQKEFAMINKYNTVKSSMIWGSQYDAMVNWMARCGNNVNITVEEGIEEDRNINNICDLYRWSGEWTLESSGNKWRYCRHDLSESDCRSYMSTLQFSI